MVIEIIFAALIVAVAVVIFVRNIKKQASGQCNCGCKDCSSSCSLPKSKQ